MKKWRVIDNYNEEVLPERFDTEEDANRYKSAKITSAEVWKKPYDFDVALLEDDTTYKEYIDSIQE